MRFIQLSNLKRTEKTDKGQDILKRGESQILANRMRTLESSDQRAGIGRFQQLMALSSGR